MTLSNEQKLSVETQIIKYSNQNTIIPSLNDSVRPKSAISSISEWMNKLQKYCEAFIPNISQNSNLTLS